MSALRGAERDALYGFARTYVRPSALARDEAAAFDRGLWRRLADTGVFRSAVDGDVAGAARAFAGLAHGGLDAPLGLSAVAQWIGVHLLARYGDAGQRGRYLESLMDGTWIVAVCNAEPNTGTDLRRMRSRIEPDGAGGYTAEIHKSSASNLSDADVAIVSAWERRGSGPRLAVIVVPARAGLVQTALVERLAGFRTGLTGALDSPAPLAVKLDEVRLGADAGRVLRCCFDLERVLIGAMIGGCVDGLLELCCEHLRGREAEDPQVVRHQYVQDKVAAIYAAGRRIEGIVGLALAGPEMAGELLSAIKLTAVEDGLQAATTAYELFGYAGYLRAGFVQKVQRDLQAFRMLGGTRELMKISLFRELWGRKEPA